jgi:hypothetical protein
MHSQPDISLSCEEKKTLSDSRQGAVLQLVLLVEELFIVKCVYETTVEPLARDGLFRKNRATFEKPKN